MKKILLSLAFALWMLLLLAAFLVVQKPDALQVKAGLGNLLLTLSIPLLMVVVAQSAGSFILPRADPAERLIFGTALGLAALGLLGFGLAMTGLATPILLAAVLVGFLLLFAWTGKLSQAWKDLRALVGEIAASARNAPKWIPAGLVAAFALTLLLGLAPPVEEFDALLYHLAVPSLWLRYGGAPEFVPLPHYWFPQIVEGIFLWPVALGADAGARILHLTWALLTVLLLWHWSRRLWGDLAAWNGLALLLTMPSILWLAAWAYTDLALTFAGLSTMYALWKWKTGQEARWLVVAGLTSGLAVSVKYTGVVVPLTGVLLIALWERGFAERLKKILAFGIVCTLAASPWYLRNWIWMGNPIYPFLLGGRGWDSFLAQSYAAPGTGIGLDPLRLLALPFTATLGLSDANFFDGRIGPFFLILSPFAAWMLWTSRRAAPEQRPALQALGALSAVGIGFWIAGVVSSAHLNQTRLLFPALIPLLIPLALGLDSLRELDAPRLKISFVARVMLALFVVLNLVNFGLQVTARNPLAAALGITSWQEYVEKLQPGYAGALTLVNAAPPEARVYILFEPRSYGMTAQVQPDAILTNFFHDAWLYQTPESILAAWKRQGYTHILLAAQSAGRMFQNGAHERQLLEQTINLLLLESQTPSGDYLLFRIP
ncbi:MAG: glycosyltransferase family 39 protein [Chloroflexota bacterium]